MATMGRKTRRQREQAENEKAAQEYHSRLDQERDYPDDHSIEAFAELRQWCLDRMTSAFRVRFVASLK